MPDAVAATASHPVTPRLPAAAALTALGIVYGDIGTSPLYALKQAADAGTPTICAVPGLGYGAATKTEGISRRQ